MLSGNIGNYFIQIDLSKNKTDGRILNKITGESAEMFFVDEAAIFADMKNKYPVVITNKGQTIIDQQNEINSLRIKVSFLEEKIKLSVKEYDDYKAF